MQHATGTFEVKLTPRQPDNETASRANVGRMSIEKQLKGDLVGTSVGEMMATGDGRQFGAYVAIERVSGTLAGKKGSFVLVHHSLMNRGVPEHWIVTVVPDSGTDELKGLSGSLRIIIEQGRHSYAFDYMLPD